MFDILPVLCSKSNLGDFWKDRVFASLSFIHASFVVRLIYHASLKVIKRGEKSCRHVKKGLSAYFLRLIDFSFNFLTKVLKINIRYKKQIYRYSDKLVRDRVEKSWRVFFCVWLILVEHFRVITNSWVKVQWCLSNKNFTETNF